MPKILIIDNDRAVRNSLKEILEYEEYKVDDVDNAIEALEMIKNGNYDLVLCDVQMSQSEGIDILTSSNMYNPDLPFIMVSGHGSIEIAVEASKKGAFDFISKPPDLNRLLITVRNALDKSFLVTEAKALKQKVSKTKCKTMLGNSPSILKIKETIDKVAPTEARVLITGANGCGKELVACLLHDKSGRANGPLIEVNCAAIPSELIESELFGHEKGSFTSAIKQRIGKFEQANGGTLFLDEIGDMSPSAQAKVLRALQENKITRVGGDKEINVNVRVIAATNKDLLKEIEVGNFRMDLYHRLNVIHIHVPTLAERSSDISLIANNFCKEICNEYGIPIKKFTSGATEFLEKFPWSGNIRELRNVVERLIILSEKIITKEDVIAYSNPTDSIYATNDYLENEDSNNFEKFISFQEYKDFTEKEFIKFKLEKNTWNVSKTAEEIDIQRSHLYIKMEKFGLKKVD